MTQDIISYLICYLKDFTLNIKSIFIILFFENMYETYSFILYTHGGSVTKRKENGFGLGRGLFVCVRVACEESICGFSLS